MASATAFGKDSFVVRFSQEEILKIKVKAEELQEDNEEIVGAIIDAGYQELFY
ncbi:unnamed protein product [marine sediment metagenome]|uniref:Uncharacterized protein n=1 Tax=marine sediment metagenome TaxID=412755 RepID=X1A2R0_9ZZZZ